jgi:hypothetical protein
MGVIVNKLIEVIKLIKEGNTSCSIIELFSS